jgi:hypothetical protein
MFNLFKKKKYTHEQTVALFEGLSFPDPLSFVNKSPETFRLLGEHITKQAETGLHDSVAYLKLTMAMLKDDEK